VTDDTKSPTTAGAKPKRAKSASNSVGAPDATASASKSKPVAGPALPVVEYSEGKGFVSPTEEILQDLRNGRMVVLVDAEDRENEGDLVIAAQMATPDAINFMAKHGRGLVCLTITEDRADQLRLDTMARTNRARMGTAFTVSIEAREGISTGISAADRALTIATAIDPTKAAKDIVSPGHVFPLIAREGGVLVRAGHTEASVDLTRMAGLYPAGVICEIMNDDGTMARMPDLVPFAQRHGLKIGTIDDLIAHRLRHDSIVREVSAATVKSVYGGDFRMLVYATTVDTVEHVALVKGDLATPGPVLVRVHAVNAAADLLGLGTEGSRGSLLQKAMEAVSVEGRGVVVLIRDQQPKSMSAWLKAELEPKVKGGKPVDDAAAKKGRERRQVEIGIGAQILKGLGLKDMVLLTNAPPSVYVGIEAYGLKIVGQKRLG
jgi:3,4-dihydroxy 2-butanone 4-phosphate synthase / GTP cyclohydrolase II